MPLLYLQPGPVCHPLLPSFASSSRISARECADFDAIRSNAAASDVHASSVIGTVRPSLRVGGCEGCSADVHGLRGVSTQGRSAKKVIHHACMRIAAEE